MKLLLTIGLLITLSYCVDARRLPCCDTVHPERGCHCVTPNSPGSNSASGNMDASNTDTVSIKSANSEADSGSDASGGAQAQSSDAYVANGPGIEICKEVGHAAGGPAGEWAAKKACEEAKKRLKKPGK